jgi:hypothetical protein
MRIWTLHPKYLDPKGLVALWREALLAQSVLRGQTKAYTKHPQLARFRSSRTPVRCVAEYLRVVHAEGKRRGYKFDSGKIARGGKVEPVVVSSGQLRYEWIHLLEKVRPRNPEWYEDLVLVKRVVPHPLFKILPGGIEKWERASGAAGPNQVS